MLREAGLLAASAKLFEKHLKSAKDGLEVSPRPRLAATHDGRRADGSPAGRPGACPGA